MGGLPLLLCSQPSTIIRRLPINRRALFELRTIQWFLETSLLASRPPVSHSLSTCKGHPQDLFLFFHVLAQQSPQILHCLFQKKDMHEVIASLVPLPSLIIAQREGKRAEVVKLWNRRSRILWQTQLVATAPALRLVWFATFAPQSSQLGKSLSRSSSVSRRSIFDSIPGNRVQHRDTRRSLVRL